MDTYQTVIIHKVLKTKTDAQLATKLIELFAKAGATKLKKEVLGTKKLAYDVKGESTGWYMVFTYVADTATKNKIERELRVDKNILKYLTIRQEDDYTYDEDEELYSYIDSAGDTHMILSANNKTKTKAHKPLVDALDIIYNLKKGDEE